MQRKITERAVVMELLNTYLAVRTKEGKHGWANTKVSKPPVAGTQHDKLQTVIEIQNTIPELSIAVTPCWIAFLNYLAGIEEQERINKKPPMLASFFPASLVRKEESMLARTCRAIRTYIVQQIIKKPDSNNILQARKGALVLEAESYTKQIKLAKANPRPNKTVIDGLEKSLAICTRNFNALAEAEKSDYHLTYFKEVIQQRDQHKNKKGKPTLHETSFDEYCSNIMSGKREPDLLYELLNAKFAHVTEENDSDDKSDSDDNSSTSSSTYEYTTESDELPELEVPARTYRQ